MTLGAEESETAELARGAGKAASSRKPWLLCFRRLVIGCSPSPLSRAISFGSGQRMVGLTLLHQTPSQQRLGQRLTRGAPAQWTQKADHTVIVSQGRHV